MTPIARHGARFILPCCFSAEILALITSDEVLS